MAEIRNRATLDSTDFQGKLKGMQGGVKTLGQSLKSMPGIGAAIGVAGLTRMVGSALKTADEIDNLSKQMSLNIETVQLYKVALGEAGLSLGTLQSAMDRLAKAESDALTGNLKYQQSFQALGISMDQLKKASPEEVLELVGRGMAETGDSAEGAAAVYDLFGRNSNKLRKVLIDLNKDGIQAQIEAYKKLGLVMDEVAIRKLDEQEVRLSRAGVSARNFGTELLSTATIGLEAIGALAGGARSMEEILEAVGLAASSAADGVGDMADEMGRLEESQQKAIDAMGEISKLLFNQGISDLGVEDQLEFFEKKLQELQRREGEAFGEDDQQKRLEILKEMEGVEKEIARLKKEQADAAEKAADAEAKSKDAAEEFRDLQGRHGARNDPQKMLEHVQSQRAAAFDTFLNATGAEETLNAYREYIALVREEEALRKNIAGDDSGLSGGDRFGSLRQMGANMIGSNPAATGQTQEARRLELMRQTERSNRDQLQVLRDILGNMNTGGARL
jgi:hypothetical protein